MNRYTIFFVDDNVDYSEVFFEQHKDEFDVLTHNDPKTVLDHIKRIMPDLIILDVHMPSKSGVEVFQDIKNTNEIENIPILFLSADERDETVLSHLKLMPEDFLFKTMSHNQVSARIKNRLLSIASKGVGGSEKDTENISFGNLEMESDKFKVKINSQDILLTNIEYKMLFYILTNRTSSPTKDGLVIFVWGDSYVASRTVNTHLSNLRAKISDANFIIKVSRIGNIIRVIEQVAASS